MFVASAVAACTVAGAAVGGIWPLATSHFLKWKYDSMSKEWRKNFNNLEGWHAKHPEAWPSSKADGDEGVLGCWLDAQVPAKQFGYMTEDEAALLASVDYPIMDVAGKLQTDEERRSNGFDLKVTIPMTLLCAALFAAIGGVSAALAGLAGIGWLALFAVFGVCVYTDVKCRHTSWQLWIVLAILALVYQLAFNGLGFHGLGGALLVTLIGLGIFLSSSLLAKGYIKAKNKRAGINTAAQVAPVGIGDYGMVAPVLLAVGVPGWAWTLFLAFVSMIAWFIISLFRFKYVRSLPFAPFLAIGMAGGLAIPAVLG